MSNLEKLTDTERLILANQYEILSKFEDSDYGVQYYKKLSNNLRNGYKWLYKDHFQCLSDVLDDNDAELVVKTLSLYRTLKNNYDDLDDKSIIDEINITFKGFDGNNESALRNYVQYFVIDLERFEELKYGQSFPRFNSHTRMLEQYRRQLKVWRNFDFDLTTEQIASILEA